MAELLSYVDAGKEGDVAPRGAGVGHWLIPIDLLSLATGACDVLTGFKPGFYGKIISVDAFVVIAGTGTGATIALNLEIGGTNMTGGVVTPTLAGTATLGAKIEGTAVTATNVFYDNEPIDIEAAAGTTFTAGMILLDIAYVVNAI